MGEKIRTHDWESTELGARARWPRTLGSMVDMMLASSQMMLIVWGPERILLYNDALADLIEPSQRGALGRPLAALPHELSSQLLPIIERALAADPSRMDDTHLQVGGGDGDEEVHLSVACTPLIHDSDEIAGALCIFQNNTERMDGEDELRRAYALIEGITQGTEDMIAAEDPQYRFLYFNEAYRREFTQLWNHDIEVGTSMVEAMAPWPEEQEKARALWGRALEGESYSVTL